VEESGTVENAGIKYEGLITRAGKNDRTGLQKRHRMQKLIC